MKTHILVVFVLFLASFSFAEVLIDNPFEAGVTSNGGYSSRTNSAATSYNYVADDFSPSGDSIIEEITLWILDNDANESDPTDVTVEFYLDDVGNGPSPSTLLGVTTIPYDDVVMTDIGEQLFGRDVYRCEVTLPDGFIVRESRGRHWVRITPVYFRSTDKWWQASSYWEAGDGAKMFYKPSTSDWILTDKESYMCITSEEMSIEETTWGQIKAAL